MKTNNTTLGRGTKGSGFSMERWRKLYVSAVEAPHEELADSEPSNNLARIFVVLLLVHVFLIGAIVLYNVFSDHTRNAAVLDNSPTPAKTLASQTAASVAAPKAQPNQPFLHHVVNGDSLASIAQKYGVEQQAIVQANKLDSTTNPFRMEMDLTIPSKTPAAAPKSNAPQAKPVGDTAKALAKAKTDAKKTPAPSAEIKNDPPKASSTAAVVKAIPMQNNPPGPTLVDAPRSMSVQDAPPTPKPGDKINSSGSAAPSIAKNSTDEDTLPTPPKPVKAKEKDDKPKTEAKSKTDAKPKTETKKQRVHVVDSDETLSEIAKRFKVSVASLRKANNLGDSRKIHEGMKLKIPNSTKTSSSSSNN